MSILRKTFLTIIVAGIGVIFLFLFYKYFAISGELELSYNFCDKPNLISVFEPAGRVSDRQQNLSSKECYQNIDSEPVYFTVNAPRSFDEVEVTLKYRNEEQNIVELGIQKTEAWNFELKPLENKYIDESEWNKLNKDNIVLLQKENNFSSIDEFINNFPTDKKIATYYYNPKIDFKIENYLPSNNILEINQTLRGKHEFYTYLENEDLDFTFIWDDINWINQEQDDFVVKVYKDDVEIYNGRQERVQLTNLSGGVYRIVIDVNDDIFIRNIKTKQQLLVVKDKLFLAANEAYENSISGLKEKASKIYFNSDELNFKTDHETGLQNVMIDNEEFSINNIGKPLIWKKQLDKEIELKKVLEVPRNDLLIQGYGYFAFTPESFFDPDYGVSLLRSDTQIEKFDYLIAADYATPDTLRSWNIATQNFNLTGVAGDRKLLNFVISAPNLNEVENIAVSEINVKLKRPALSFNRIINKIKDRL